LVFNGLIAVLLVFINRILLKTLRQPDFFSFVEDEAPRAVGDGGLEGGGLGSVPPVRETGEKEKIVQAVVEYMQRKKPYLESELTLDQLAAQLSLKPRLLSRSINEMLGQNFFDFINHYRIEEARRLLTNPKDEKITILEVLYEVGFNSKSSFNTLFKKYTGLTPTEFRKNQSR
jgi:AraC-like DNA-binding protein